MELNYWELDSMHVKAVVSEKCARYLIDNFVKLSKSRNYTKGELAGALTFYRWNYLAEGLKAYPENITAAELTEALSSAIKAKYHVTSAASKFGSGVNKDAILAAANLALQARKYSGKENTRALDEALKGEEALGSIISTLFRAKRDRLSVSVLNILVPSLNAGRETIQREVEGYVVQQGHLIKPKISKALIKFAGYTARYGKAYGINHSYRVMFVFKSAAEVSEFLDACKELELPLIQHTKREFMLHRIGILYVLSAYLGVDFSKIQENREKALKALDSLRKRFDTYRKTPIEERGKKQRKPSGEVYVDLVKDIRAIVYLTPTRAEIEQMGDRLTVLSKTNRNTEKLFFYRLVAELVSVGRASITRRAVILRSRNAAILIHKLGLPEIAIKDETVSIPRYRWDDFSSGMA